MYFPVWSQICTYCNNRVLLLCIVCSFKHHVQSILEYGIFIHIAYSSWFPKSYSISIPENNTFDLEPTLSLTGRSHTSMLFVSQVDVFLFDCFLSLNLRHLHCLIGFFLSLNL